MTTPSPSVIARAAFAIYPRLLTPHTVFTESQSAEVVDEIVVTGERLEAGYLEKQAEIGFGFPAASRVCRRAYRWLPDDLLKISSHRLSRISWP